MLHYECYDNVVRRKNRSKYVFLPDKACYQRDKPAPTIVSLHIMLTLCFGLDDRLSGQGSVVA